ncbi:phosphatase PAP2 family protein [Anaeromicropila populeti]|uniref:Undecaprenyl-diphosphatase n=1 Tax=Anaeromicropila populeti TaxID=37658 RepID=A0A1I6IQI3_9FIRM|nr:phosphatase PAP2 family protein [Anaeromicropila populeti]SFR69002.1 undecaprenyl-diphosphatase [Anaeromicropila populeti]
MITTITELDQNILLWIQEYLRTPVLTKIMQMITVLGDNAIIWTLIGFGLVFYAKYRRVGFVVNLSVMLEMFVVNQFLKNIFARTRPFVAMEELEHLTRAPHSYSFPSGHTASSFAAAMVLFLMLPRKYGISALCLAALIGFSRIYLGVHYLTDVLAGMALGMGIAYISVYAGKKIPE